jgi:hypothetical protein
VLDPSERLAEVLFGLIMALTFTGSLSVAEAGRDDVRAMLVGALGCNLAWGLIDGIFYVMGSLAARGMGLSALRAVRAAARPAEARRLIVNALPDPIAAVMTPEELDTVAERLRQSPEPATRARMSSRDLVGALGVFLLVFLSTLPVALPFLLLPDTPTAMRTSNAVAVGLLFVVGFFHGRLTGRSPLAVGLSMVALGAALVAITIALGG